MLERVILNGIVTTRWFSAKITLRSILHNKIPIMLIAIILNLILISNPSLTFIYFFFTHYKPPIYFLFFSLFIFFLSILCT